MVEAVTSRVSVLPVVRSDLLTSLSVAAGVTDQLFLGSGSSLDKVGHGAGQSGVRMVLVELWRSYVKSVILCFLGCGQWPFCTSQFFLLDKEGDLEMPLRINGGRASLQQEVDFNDCYKCYPQKIEQVQGVGPAENRWDGHHILTLYVGSAGG